MWGCRARRRRDVSTAPPTLLLDVPLRTDPIGSPDVRRLRHVHDDARHAPAAEASTSNAQRPRTTVGGHARSRQGERTAGRVRGWQDVAGVVLFGYKLGGEARRLMSTILSRPQYQLGMWAHVVS